MNNHKQLSSHGQSMSDQQFDIIFRGDILPGHHIGEVKRRLAQLFKTDETRINGLFGGAAVPLKRNLDADTAEKYRTALTRAGALVDLAPVKGGKSKPKPALKRPPASPVPAGPEAVTPVRPSWSLAPVGSDLAPEKASPAAAEVDISGLSLRPMEGDLLDASEKKVAVDVELDLSVYELAEVGADLISSEEKSALPQIEVALPEFELAPVGSNLGGSEDRGQRTEDRYQTPDWSLRPISDS